MSSSTVEDRQRSVAGTGLSYYASGPASQEAVILFHGFASDSIECWFNTRWIAELERRGVRAIAVDLPGHGRSQEVQGFSSTAVLNHLARVLDEEQVRSADVIGFSLGALVAIQFGAVDSRVQSVAALGVGQEAIVSTFPEEFADIIRGTSEPEDSRGIALKAYASRHPVRTEQYARFAEQFEFWVPTGPNAPEHLIVAGGEDPFSQDPGGLASSLRHSRWTCVAGLGHFELLASRSVRILAVDFATGSGERKRTDAALPTKENSK